MSLASAFSLFCPQRILVLCVNCCFETYDLHQTIQDDNDAPKVYTLCGHSFTLIARLKIEAAFSASLNKKAVGDNQRHPYIHRRGALWVRGF